MMQILAHASEDDLMRARNPAYMALFSTKAKLEGNVEGYRWVSSQVLTAYMQPNADICVQISSGRP